jgi:hypothetical protein
MEDAMARRKLWSNSVSRVELDHRARDARARLVRLERLLVPRAAAAGFRLVRLFGLRRLGEAARGDRTRRSLSNRQRGCMTEIDSVWFEGCGALGPVRTILWPDRPNSSEQEREAILVIKA